MEVALIVLDGWGLGPADDPDHRNAVAAAATPTMDDITSRGATGRLSVSGRNVGLPDGQMGNSEVGHVNIGAGRVVYQEYTRINDAIRASGLATMAAEDELTTAGDDPAFDENEAILAALEHARTHDGCVHLMGLVSDGGVHSDLQHLFALIEMAAEAGVPAVTHAFTDGRDTDPHGGREYLAALESEIDRHGTGDVATVIGRYYAMDRDQNWERTVRAYDAIVNGEAAHDAPTASDAIESAYEREESDEFVVPTTVDGGSPLTDGDAVVFFNFRSDRGRQLARMLGAVRPGDWEEVGIERDPPGVTLTTMTEYDRTFDFPVAFPPRPPTTPIGAVWEAHGCTQLRIAESEKYAHVTYFLNGGREVEYDGEIRRIVESPDVPTYDLQPEMSAAGVTDQAIEVIGEQNPDAIVLNYANPDMVGHTGDFEAAVSAVEAVDTQLGRLLEAVQAAGGHAVVTADHGNADDMGTADAPHTAHTRNDVPFVYLAPDGSDGNMQVDRVGMLADIAPTLLWLMNLEPPEAMTGRSLLVDEGNP